MDKIEISSSNARVTSNLYKTIITELDTMTKDLKQCIDDIPSNWKGSASDTFCMDHFPQIYTNMQKQITLLRVINTEIYLAAESFENLEVDLKSKS